nr:MAG TPA: hypothetical protein [Caudoviricetes sp.]
MVREDSDAPPLPWPAWCRFDSCWSDKQQLYQKESAAPDSKIKSQGYEHTR